MTGGTLNYQPITPEPLAGKSVRTAAAVAAVVVLAANLILLGIAYADHSWGAWASP